MKQKVSGAMIPDAKRSRSAQPPPSKPTINDLPDLVLVEILCRLPHNKFVFRCKLVSKSWRTLLSHPYFIRRFLRIQHDQQKPLQNSYVMVPYRDAKHKTLVLTMSSKLPPPPLLKTSISSVFSFFPCFQGHDYAEKGDKLSVPGTYNDLVLCSPTTYSQRDYYICNSNTKEWVRLPPTPRVYKSDLVLVGLICEPYYNIEEDVTSSNSSIVKLNAEYRCKVVRILPNYLPNDHPVHPVYMGFYVEIFSSETGEWREYPSSKILCEQRQFITFSQCPGVACNGKLYWLMNHNGSVFELDPFNISSTGDVIDKCRFIDGPAAVVDHFKGFWHIGEYQGCLRMFPYFVYASRPIIIWELKENQGDGKPEWCLIFDQVSLSEMVPKQPFIPSSFQIVGFHPIHGDIVFLQDDDVYNNPRYIVMCNVRLKTLEIATKIPFENSPGVCWVAGEIFPYVIPWWPTPVPRRLDYREECLNVTVNGVDTFTVKVGCLTTLKQLKQELGTGQYELYFDGRVLDDDDRWITRYGIKDKSEIYIGEHCWKEWLRLEPY